MMYGAFTVLAQRDGKFWVLRIFDTEMHLLGITQVHAFVPLFRQRATVMARDWIELNNKRLKDMPFDVTVYRC